MYKRGKYLTGRKDEEDQFSYTFRKMHKRLESNLLTFLHVSTFSVLKGDKNQL